MNIVIAIAVAIGLTLGSGVTWLMTHAHTALLTKQRDDARNGATTAREDLREYRRLADRSAAAAKAQNAIDLQTITDAYRAIIDDDKNTADRRTAVLAADRDRLRNLLGAATDRAVLPEPAPDPGRRDAAYFNQVARWFSGRLVDVRVEGWANADTARACQRALSTVYSTINSDR